MSEHSIQGVETKLLKWRKDDRGRLLEILRCNDEIFNGFGQVYVTVVLPDVVKAWHYHKKQDDSFVALAGKVRVAMTGRHGRQPLVVPAPQTAGWERQRSIDCAR